MAKEFNNRLQLLSNLWLLCCDFDSKWHETDWLSGYFYTLCCRSGVILTFIECENVPPTHIICVLPGWRKKKTWTLVKIEQKMLLFLKLRCCYVFNLLLKLATVHFIHFHREDSSCLHKVLYCYSLCFVGYNIH